MDTRRPAKSRQTLPVMRYKNIELDLETGRASKDGQPVALSPKELCLLAFLLCHRGQAFSRAELLDRVWGVATPLRTARWICTSASCGASWGRSWTFPPCSRWAIA